MKRMPFKRPTEDYDLRLLDLDEQLCALLQRRKQSTEGNPGFPPSERILEWADKYGFYEDYLNAFFSFLMNGDRDYRPVVEPRDYRRSLLVAQAVEKDGNIYSVTAIRQYENASVISFHIDRKAEEERPDERKLRRHVHYELSMEAPYDAWFDGGGGSGHHQVFSYIVTPPLPDDISGLKLVFSASKRFLQEGAEELDIHIRLN